MDGLENVRLKLKSNFKLTKQSAVVLGLLSGLTYAFSLTFTEKGIVDDAMAQYPDTSIYILSIILQLTIFIIAFVAMLFKKEFKGFFNFVKTKNGIIYSASQIILAPAAMLALYGAVAQIGSGYTSMVTSLYPAIGAVMAFFVLKETLSKKGFFGIILCVVAVGAQGFVANSIVTGNLALGLLFALITVFAWAINTIVQSFVLKQAISQLYVILLSSFFTIVASLIIMLPYGVQHDVGQIIFSSATLNSILAGVNSLLSLAFFYSTIKCIGASRAMCLNITYSAWQVLINYFFLDMQVTIIMVLGVILLFVGSTLTILPTKKLLKE